MNKPAPKSRNGASTFCMMLRLKEKIQAELHSY